MVYTDYRVDVVAQFQLDFGTKAAGSDVHEEAEELIRRMFKESLPRAQCVRVNIIQSRKI